MDPCAVNLCNCFLGSPVRGCRALWSPVPHVSGKRFSCVRPAAPSFHLMSLVLTQYLTGKTHSQVIFQLTSRQISFAQLLPWKGDLIFPVAAIFLLCTASAADKSFRVPRLPGLLGTRALHGFTSGQRNACLITETQEYSLGLTTASAQPAEGACSTLLLKPYNKEHSELLLSRVFFVMQQWKPGEWFGRSCTQPWPIPVGTTCNSEMKSVTVYKETKHNPASLCSHCALPSTNVWLWNANVLLK